jgi:hypothetical protein
MSLIDVGALGLTHLNKVIDKQFAVIFTYPSGFAQALVRIKT